MVNLCAWLKLNDWLNRASLTLYPPLCCLCGDNCASAAIDICPACRTTLPWNDYACPRCALPTAGGASMCRCYNAAWPFTTAHVPLLYEGAVTSLISGFKFHRRLTDGHLLGQLLARSLRATGQELPAYLIPLPLHSHRLRQRGFEQTAELARALCRELPEITPLALLRRQRNTAQQAHLAVRQRHYNVHGAFAVAGRIAMPEHVALLDDVVTTGATAQAAAQTLLTAGAQRIDLWAVARAGIY